MSETVKVGLREELARRLREIYEDHRAIGAEFSSMADECIRQMEWARRGDPNAKSQNFYPEEGAEIVHDSEIGHGFTPLSWVALTPAPEGWKP